jgi:mannose-6-phosphate isomerase
LGGLRKGIDRATLTRELARHTSELCVERIEPQVGDCFFVPAGVVHALGPGLLIFEIQQSSDTTYRLYDWNRPGPDGKPRAVHVEAAMEAIDFSYGPLKAVVPQDGAHSQSERLVACDAFVLDRWRFSDRVSVGGDQGCHILAVLQGQVDVEHDPSGRPLTRGDVALVPAALGPVALTAREPAVVLEAYLP